MIDKEPKWYDMIIMYLLIIIFAIIIIIMVSFLFWGAWTLFKFFILPIIKLIITVVVGIWDGIAILAKTLWNGISGAFK